MAEMWISMGPQHPMTHGLWTLKVKVDGETVVDTEPDLGYIHRGVEKICEARDFTQITTYCDRLCYASANENFRIKSPLLYQLSYGPKDGARFCRRASGYVLHPSGFGVKYFRRKFQDEPYRTPLRSC